MKYIEYKENVEKILEKNKNIYKQCYIMFIPEQYKINNEIPLNEEVME
jgi:hypothetical protein